MVGYEKFSNVVEVGGMETRRRTVNAIVQRVRRSEQRFSYPRMWMQAYLQAHIRMDQRRNVRSAPWPISGITGTGSKKKLRLL